MRSFFVAVAAMLIGAASAPPAESPLPAAPGLSYADLADLALAAPVAAHVRVRDAIALRGERAAALPAHLARFYVEAEVLGLIRGGEGIAPRISYVVDLSRDASGRAPKLRKGTELILLAVNVPGRAAELRLVAPDAQLAYSAGQAARLRAILREATAPDPAPRITGIGRAFHVPGALPGEGETQIFLQTSDARPVSLSVLRRPGQTPIWSVALSEIVDDAAATPRPETLLWYRLACTLPPTLPAQSFAEAGEAAAAAIRADYRLILDRLGPCLRTRPRR